MLIQQLIDKQDALESKLVQMEQVLSFQGDAKEFKKEPTFEELVTPYFKS